MITLCDVFFLLCCQEEVEIEEESERIEKKRQAITDSNKVLDQEHEDLQKQLAEESSLHVCERDEAITRKGAKIHHKIIQHSQNSIDLKNSICKMFDFV